MLCLSPLIHTYNTTSPHPISSHITSLILTPPTSLFSSISHTHQPRMASSTATTPSAAKQLGELLQEQQEPFTLEVYLLERGYMGSKMNSERRFRCCSTNSREVIPKCSRIVRAVFNKLVTTRKDSKEETDGVSNRGKNREDNAETFSSASSTTVFNSCSASDTEDACVSSEASTRNCRTSGARNFQSEGQVATDRDYRWRCLEESKQLSPVSVLEEKLSADSSPINKRETRQEVYSTLTGCKLEDQSPTGKQNRSLPELAHSDSSPEYVKIKMALQQSKQLLFDCVREVVETHRWKDKRHPQSKKLLGPEELGKLFCDNIRTWSHIADGTDTIQLLSVSGPAEDWDDIEQQSKEIGMSIGDAILEDMSYEIVVDMVKFRADRL